MYVYLKSTSTGLVHQCQLAKVGAENIIAVVDNTVRVTHIHKKKKDSEK
jgi:hypothetical protein